MSGNWADWEQNDGWQRLPGEAQDIGVGANGAVWVIGTGAEPGGFGIWQWTGANWNQVPGGGAVRIAVGPDGYPWVVNNTGSIFRFNGYTFVPLPGSAHDIAVGPDGNAWVVNNTGSIYAFNGYTFMPMPGSGFDIGVGADGSAWVIGTGAESGGFGIWRSDGNNWNQVPGGATNISVGPDGLAWVVNSWHNIYRRTRN